MNEEIRENENKENEQSTKEELINENANQEKKTLTFSENLSNDFSNGLHSVLYKKINNVTINDSRIAEVFSRFLKEVECGGSFSVMDILTASESVVKGTEPNENAGNLIYCYDHLYIANKSVAAKLLNNSVGGIYSLFAIHNGIALDIDAVGSSIPAAEAKRYLLIPPKKERKFLEIAGYNDILLVKAGVVIAENKIHLSRNDEIIASVDKAVMQDNSHNSIAIGPEHYAAFTAGYNAVCSLTLCNCVGYNNLIRFGLGGNLSEICARALGVYCALSYLKTLPVRMIFTNENKATVAVSRPNVGDGDYLYLLKLRNDSNGLPDKAHFGQLFYYLNEKKRLNIIKDVLPVRENIDKVIFRLSNTDAEYVSLAQVPENCFGVIVSVGRGESVNGIKLGYFKGN